MSGTEFLDTFQFRMLPGSGFYELRDENVVKDVSLIPIATGLGRLLGIVLAGSYLIEKVFNINGFGLLGFTSIVKRDAPVVLGILVMVALLRLFGNIFSDILYAVIDPRIRFK